MVATSCWKFLEGRVDLTPLEIKGARQKLGLTQPELAALWDTDKDTVRKMEQSPDTKTFRKPAPRMLRLLEAYLSGYRPNDWPSK